MLYYYLESLRAVQRKLLQLCRGEARASLRWGC